MRQNLKKYPLLGLGSALVAMAFSLMMVWGQALDSVGEIPIRSLLSWCSFLALFAGSYLLLLELLVRVRENRVVLFEHAKEQSIQTEDIKQQKINKKDIACWFGLVLCWLPSFLAVYPGFFLYDAYDEYMQVANGVFSEHHPLLHVLLLGKTIRFVHKLTGSFNLGIATYIVVQMCVIAACFAYVLHWMKENGVSKTLRRIAFCYFAFFPNVVMFSLCSTKDVLFAAMLLVCVLQYIRLDKEGEQVSKKKIFWMLLCGAQLMALLLRNNAVYAYLVFVVLLVVFWKNKRKSILFVSLLTMFLYIICSGGLASHLNAAPGGKQEMLTVPIQQISRSFRADREYLTAEDKERLFRILPESAIERYVPKLSDPVKYHFDNEAYKKDTAGFWKIWLKLFRHNPVGYVNAWLMTSYGYWYPDAQVDIYRGSSVFTHSYENSSYFGFETEEPGIRNSKLPFLEAFYEELALEDVAQKIPGISWMFSMGFIAWIYVVAACILVAKKAYGSLLYFAFPALVWMTLLLGPTYLPRYVVFIWYLLPVLAAELHSAVKH